MARPPDVHVPDEAVPVFVAPVLDLHARARFWARLATLASVLVAVSSVFLAWNGRIAWWAAIALLVAAYFPLAAETRIVELRVKLELQLRDRALERRSEIEADRGRP